MLPEPLFGLYFYPLQAPPSCTVTDVWLSRENEVSGPEAGYRLPTKMVKEEPFTFNAMSRVTRLHHYITPEFLEWRVSTALGGSHPRDTSGQVGAAGCSPGSYSLVTQKGQMNSPWPEERVGQGQKPLLIYCKSHMLIDSALPPAVVFCGPRAFDLCVF